GRDSIEKLSTPLKARIHNRLLIQGFIAGLDFVYQCCWIRFFGSYEFHWGRARSRVEYHLPKQFRYSGCDRSKNGFGNTVNLGVGYIFSTEWEIALGLRYRDWHNYEGNHKTIFTFGTNQQVTHGRVKKIEWNSWDFTVDGIMRF